MASYMMQVQVTLTRLPDPPPEIDDKREGVEHKLLTMAEKALGGSAPFLHMQNPPGMSMTRCAVIAAEGFPDLAKILASYDALTEQTECNHP